MVPAQLGCQWEKEEDGMGGGSVCCMWPFGDSCNPLGLPNTEVSNLDQRIRDFHRGVWNDQGQRGKVSGSRKAGKAMRLT